MTISDINARVIEEFSRISTSNTPSIDDGGGPFLSTVQHIQNYWTPFDKIPAHPCLMIIPFKRMYEPRFTDMSGLEVTVVFDIHGVVQAGTGTTGGKVNAATACENLIEDCVRTARVLFKSDIEAAGTRFKIAPKQQIITQPVRLDENGNRYAFFFNLSLSTFPIYVI